MVKMIPLIRPDFGEEEAEAAVKVIRSGWLMAGPKTTEFEKAFAKKVVSRHACAVSSCTAGLHLALRALGVKRGDAVVTVSHSFIATANVTRLAGAEPVFVDISPDTYNMNPKSLSSALDELFEKHGKEYWFKNPETLARGESPWVGCKHKVGRLAAILIPHQVGLPADLAEILPLAKAANVPVLEDAACAVGAEISLDGGTTWKPIGTSIGAAACFSFHPRKIITTGEGGMITTHNSEVDRMVRVLRQHGMDRSTIDRENSVNVVREQYLHTTTNYRMTDIQAAIGLIQLGRLNAIIDQRRKLATRYNNAITNLKDAIPPKVPSYARTTYQSYVVRFKGKEGKAQKIANYLKENGVDTRPGIMCAHHEPPYSENWPKGSLPESELATQETLILPLFPGMTEDEQERVLTALEDAVKLN